MDNAQCCPTGTGGNSTITNQDEQEILNRTMQMPKVRVEGMQDSEAH
jgi:hypothetical protein